MTNFDKNSRDYALDLVEQGLVDPTSLLTACLNFLSTQEVREMLDANELSPRFLEEEDEEPKE